MAGETGLIYHTSTEGIINFLLVAAVFMSAGLIFVSHRCQRGSGTLCNHWYAPRTTREGGATTGIQMSMVPPKTGYERIA